MSSMNKVLILGNLGKDPEMKMLPSGQAVTEFTVATNDQWTDKSGQRQERTEWHRIVVWGRQAEQCAQYLKKGRTVFLEGRLQTRQWDDKATGQKRYTTEIIANNVQFIGGQGTGQGGGGRGYEDQGAPMPEPAGRDLGPAVGGVISDEDVPF